MVQFVVFPVQRAYTYYPKIFMQVIYGKYLVCTVLFGIRVRSRS